MREPSALVSFARFGLVALVAFAPLTLALASPAVALVAVWAAGGAVVLAAEPLGGKTGPPILQRYSSRFDG